MRTVLVVDDDEQARLAVEMALEKVTDLTIRSAADGAEALEILRGAQPRIDALVTDLRLPEMDGYELASRMRGDPAFEHMPIVVVTADANPETARALKTAGVNAVFLKPFSHSQLRLVVEALLNAR